ncbi:two-component sensor histidine kinase, partial [Corallococcus llansteffanensis]
MPGMRLYQQLILFMLAATVLPLAAVGFLLLSRAEAEVVSHIDDKQRALASATAEAVGTNLMEVVNGLARSAELIDWERATPDELRGGLALLYGQSPTISAVLGVDAQGRQLGQAVYRAEARNGHPGFEEAGLMQLAKALPVQSLRGGGKGQAALGSAYMHAGSGRTAMVVGVKLADGEAAPYALAEVVFTQLEALLRRRAGEGPTLLDVVDAEGRVLASSQPERRMKALEPELLGGPDASGRPDAARSFHVKDPARRVSVARVPIALGMDVVVTVEEAQALAPVRQLRRTVLV